MALKAIIWGAAEGRVHGSEPYFEAHDHENLSGLR